MYYILFLFIAHRNLAAELVNYYQEMQDKQRAPVPKMTSASSSVSSREDEERRVKQEILEEHNKRLEDELLRYRELIRASMNYFSYGDIHTRLM